HLTQYQIGGGRNRWGRVTNCRRIVISGRCYGFFGPTFLGCRSFYLRRIFPVIKGGLIAGVDRHGYLLVSPGAVQKFIALRPVVRPTAGPYSNNDPGHLDVDARWKIGPRWACTTSQATGFGRHVSCRVGALRRGLFPASEPVSPRSFCQRSPDCGELRIPL